VILEGRYSEISATMVCFIVSSGNGGRGEFEVHIDWFNLKELSLVEHHVPEVTQGHVSGSRFKSK
jgi:hypothetical protein